MTAEPHHSVPADGRRLIGPAGLVFGCVGLVLLPAWFSLGPGSALPLPAPWSDFVAGLSLVCGLLAAILGAVGLRQIPKGYSTSWATAVAGLVCGLLTLVIWVAGYLTVLYIVYNLHFTI